MSVKTIKPHDLIVEWYNVIKPYVLIVFLNLNKVQNPELDQYSLSIYVGVERVRENFVCSSEEER